MIKNIQDIEKEYKDYQIKTTYINDLDEFQTFIEIAIDEVENNTSLLLEEIKLNYKDQILAQIRNFFLFMFQIEEVSYYSEDNEVLKEIITYSTEYIEYLNRILNVANEDNINRLIRLTDFLNDYYNEQICFFESKRDALEYRVKGFMYKNNRYSDNKEVINEFFDKEISKYNNEKAVEKIKKMW